MRETKFRLWTGKTMITNNDDFFIGLNGSVISDNYERFESQSNVVSFEDFIKSVDYQIMQYTGLKDKNGKEIYEGDLLDFDEKEWGEKFKPEVITFEKITGKWGLRGTLSEVSLYRKVIGNIYENPELLNESP